VPAAIERAFRKEHQRLAARGHLKDAARIGRPLMSVEALDEFRAQPPQEQARQRDAHHLLLDDEGEIRR